MNHGSIYPELARYNLSYSLRSDVWTLYARSGERTIRDFAQDTNRTFLDGRLLHCDGPRKVRGLFGQVSGAEDALKMSLPYYWAAGTQYNLHCSTQISGFLLDYYLTGYRRAGDCLREFADGMTRFWTPQGVRQWRIIKSQMAMTEVYTATWDRDLRALCDLTGQYMQDPECALGLCKATQGYSTSYKTQADLSGLILQADVFGYRAYHDMARKVAEFYWAPFTEPIGYQCPAGYVAGFLYDETGDPAIAAGAALMLAALPAARDPATGGPPHMRVADLSFLFRGFALAQDVVRRAGLSEKNLTAWAGAEDFGFPVSLAVFKEADQAVEITYRAPTEGAGGMVQVSAIHPKSDWGLDLNVVRETSLGRAEITIPKDAPRGAYLIQPGRRARNTPWPTAACRWSSHAPEYWIPLPALLPAARVYFNVPQDARGAQIFFAGSARLFDPQGKPLGDGPQSKWIDLPGDRPGLWSFEPVRSGLVRVRNLPPLFAVGRREAWFDPDLPWSRSGPQGAAEPAPPPGVRFVPGAIQTPGNQALYLRGQQRFTLAAGAAVADGGRFLPFRQGTIEFWFRPSWDTFSLADGTKTLWEMPTAGPSGWRMTYLMDAAAASAYQSHALLGWMPSDGRIPHLGMRVYRRTLFEQDRWVHVAYVWGRQADRGEPLTSAIYVDGKRSMDRAYSFAGQHVEFAPRQFILHGSLEGAVDELRVSGSQRDARFRSAVAEPRVGAGRRHAGPVSFQRQAEGRSFGHDGPLPARLE